MIYLMDMTQDKGVRLYYTLDNSEMINLDDLNVSREDLVEMEDREIHNLLKTELNRKINEMEDEEELEYYRRMRFDLFAVTLVMEELQDGEIKEKEDLLFQKEI